MKRKVNPNLKILLRTYLSNKTKEFRDSEICVLEGSSRSGKTISSVDFIIWYCLQNENKNTFCIRDTYNSHKTSLYIDFHNRLRAFGLPSPFETAKEVSNFKIGLCTVHFVGADKPSKLEGAGCDIAYFNEILDIQKAIFDTVEQRCSEFIICDYNPKYSMHWVYDSILKRNDVVYLHSTVSNNPFCPPSQLKKIKSYEPTPENIAQGTADDYRWNVYGLGLRCSQEGLIFKQVHWISEFPTDVDRVFYGNDFGYSVDPNALVKVAVNGQNLFFEEKLYTPIDNSGLLYKLIQPIVKDDNIWCDSADRDFVTDLRLMGLNAFKAKKYAGCIDYRIDLMKRYKINIVDSPNFRKEQQNYAYRTIQGIQTNEPIDAFNHLWDACGYACQHELRSEM